MLANGGQWGQLVAKEWGFETSKGSIVDKAIKEANSAEANVLCGGGSGSFTSGYRDFGHGSEKLASGNDFSCGANVTIRRTKKEKRCVEIFLAITLVCYRQGRFVGANHSEERSWWTWKWEYDELGFSGTLGESRELYPIRFKDRIKVTEKRLDEMSEIRMRAVAGQDGVTVGVVDAFILKKSGDNLDETAITARRQLRTSDISGGFLAYSQGGLVKNSAF